MADTFIAPAHSFRRIEVVYRTIDELKVDPKNPRDHSPKQVKQLVRSIETFGFTSPVLIDRNLKVIAGHGRILAAKKTNLLEIPTICLDHLSPHQATAYMIADNRLTEIATWNDELLAEHLQFLSSLELDFDLDVIGFDIGEIDLRIGNGSSISDEVMDQSEADVDLQETAVTRMGDIWKLGRHLILCGNSLDEDSYKNLLGKDVADVIFTDPPYNVPIAGHASGLGRKKHSDFVMASGEMTSKDFEAFLTDTCRNLVKYSRAGSIHYICMDWRHIDELSAAGRQTYSELKNICVWVKSNAGMGSLYRSQHELVFVYKNGDVPHHNNVQLGRFGRSRTNVWSYQGASAPAAGDEERGLLQLHPTVKPVTLVADALIDCSKPNDVVLDPFGGSGTTIIAAERTGRRARVIEMDPRYVDVAIRRWESFTRQSAVHAFTGKSYQLTCEQDS